MVVTPCKGLALKARKHPLGCIIEPLENLREIWLYYFSKFSLIIFCVSLNSFVFVASSSRIFISSSVSSSAFSIRLSKIAPLVMSLWVLSFLDFLVALTFLLYRQFYLLFLLTLVLFVLIFHAKLLSLKQKRDNISAIPFKVSLLKFYVFWNIIYVSIMIFYCFLFFLILVFPFTFMAIHKRLRFTFDSQNISIYMFYFFVTAKVIGSKL